MTLFETNLKTENQTVKTCDECGSSFFTKASRMIGLCPECSHLIYGYENCRHIFIDGRCSDCHWNGSTSDFSKKQEVYNRNIDFG